LDAACRLPAGHPILATPTTATPTTATPTTATPMMATPTVTTIWAVQLWPTHGDRDQYGHPMLATADGLL
jgi:hypothetical protein